MVAETLPPTTRYRPYINGHGEALLVFPAVHTSCQPGYGIGSGRRLMVELRFGQTAHGSRDSTVGAFRQGSDEPGYGHLLANGRGSLQLITKVPPALPVQHLIHRLTRRLAVALRVGESHRNQGHQVYVLRHV